MEPSTANFLMTALLSLQCLFLLSLRIPHVESRLWQENPKPKLEVSNDEYMKSAKVFLGNNSRPDHFRLLERDDTSLLIGARNIVFNVSLSTLEENQRIEWSPSPQDVGMCTTKGKELEECQNFIRVLIKKSPSDLLICGTNAFKPMCRNYTKDPASGSLVKQEEFSGLGRCPFDPEHNSTAIVVDEDIFAGTVIDFMGQKPIIMRSNRAPLKTEALTEPNFVSSVSIGEFIYFFLRETADEISNCEKVQFPRVARVCKKDRGGARDAYRMSFTSFLKARLNCSVAGAYPFYFNELQSISGPYEGNYNGVQTQIFYGVFGTPPNSIAGSAVCAFSLTDIEQTFNGPFKRQVDRYHNWQEVPSYEVPEPRPGKCVEDSRTLPDNLVTFINRNPLMDRAVPSLYSKPVLIYTSIYARYTAVAVAPQIRTVDDRRYDVLFVGTDDGRVIKSINLDLQHTDSTEDTVVIEDIEVLGRQEARNRGPVINLRVVDEQLIVVFKDQIQAMPLHRCHLKLTCRDCVSLRDPMCAWMDNKCRHLDSVSSNTVWPKNGHGPVQNVETGRDDRCPAESSIYATSANDVSRNPANGRKLEDNEVPEYQTSTAEIGNVYKEETLAVAVVVTLLLSLMAGVAIGFLLSRYRNSAFKESTLSESSDYSYGHRSIGPNRPSDYQSEPIYAPPEFPPTKAINVVLNMHRNTLKNLSAAPADTKPVPSSKKVYL